MGNVVDCCAVSSDKKETVSTVGPQKRSNDKEETIVPPTAAELKAFRDRLENSIHMTVVIAVSLTRKQGRLKAEVNPYLIYCDPLMFRTENGYLVVCDGSLLTVAW
ncbi:hypothetical protein GNI_060870 [Gregarina niphandrodes]|uniref:Uncharacterized protein n=1 Tax=Gregarina niphandrodes TaxID=110365 RepID=A0A023B8B7_GRENI|nr:hypothetical protein GNI_060870 [Gregarina niphandrodes]EZG68907.1 hypothetical protein GNI_060870 [Gregarina niphandrodes]|eukprot:XP_011134531.1 hypothetical protein GNI_060870 [Gregarina niphandrodes]